jgi:hypothetical protein
MRTYIQTRGKNSDYQFLGAAPPKAWWLLYRDATSFEQPTLIVTGDKEVWQCYLSGITSSRTDRVGTTIRYTLVMEGTCDPRDKEVALPRIIAWLGDVASTHTNQGKQRKLGKAIDSILEESDVESLLLPGSSISVDVLFSTLKLAAPVTAHQGQRWGGSWTSSMYSERAQYALLQRIEEVLDGKQEGFAAWLNLLGNTNEVSTLAQKIAGECAVLIDISTDKFEDHYTLIEKPVSTPQTPPEAKKDSKLPLDDNLQKKCRPPVVIYKQSPPKLPVWVVIWTVAALIVGSIIIMIFYTVS